jgi:hypothetical protein
MSPPLRLTRRGVLVLTAGAAVSLIPWTAGLAVTLPRHYDVGTWSLTWTGFDIALIASFTVTAWGMWRQRQVALPAAMATSVLLLCDAWFDLLTAHRGSDLLVSAATAIFGEIPLAVLLGVTAMRLLRAGIAVPASRMPMGSVWRTPIATPSESPRPKPTVGSHSERVPTRQALTEARWRSAGRPTATVQQPR